MAIGNLSTKAANSFTQKLLRDLVVNKLDVQTDNHGQLIVYTGQFMWADGSVQSTPDPAFSDDPTDA